MGNIIKCPIYVYGCQIHKSAQPQFPADEVIHLRQVEFGTTVPLVRLLVRIQASLHRRNQSLQHHCLEEFGHHANQ